MLLKVIKTPARSFIPTITRAKADRAQNEILAENHNQVVNARKTFDLSSVEE